MFLLIDEASFQHPGGAAIDFVPLKNAGVVGVYVKATEGLTYTNPWLDADAKGALAAGLHLGFYHFFHPSQDPVKQALYFLAAVRSYGNDLRLALDHEVSDSLSPAPVAAAAVTCERTLAANIHYAPLLYTYPSFAQEGYCAGLGGYPLWLADPSGSAVPAPWASDVLVQTGQGNESGVRVAVDQDSAPDLGPLLVPSTPEEDSVAVIIQVEGNPAQAISDGIFRKQFAGPADEQWEVKAGLVKPGVTYISQENWNDLIDAQTLARTV